MAQVEERTGEAFEFAERLGPRSRSPQQHHNGSCSAPSADAALNRPRPPIDTRRRFPNRGVDTAMDRRSGATTPYPGRPGPSGPRDDAIERIERPDQDPPLTTWL